MTISATIFNILEIKELDGIWQPKVIFDMIWSDSRLKIQSLKEDVQLNVLTNEEREDIWVPIVIFVNNNESQRFALDEDVSIVVRKEGNGTITDSDDLDSDNDDWI